MARIGALIITVMLLSAVLAQSSDIKIISKSLFGGRPTHRYLGVTGGTAVLSVPLNFGAVGVIATMIVFRSGKGVTVGWQEMPPERWCADLGHRLCLLLSSWW